VNADPEARLDHSREHRVGTVVGTPHSLVCATSTEFLAAATRCVIEMDERERKRET